MKKEEVNYVHSIVFLYFGLLNQIKWITIIFEKVQTQLLSFSMFSFIFPSWQNIIYYFYENKTKGLLRYCLDLKSTIKTNINFLLQNMWLGLCHLGSPLLQNLWVIQKEIFSLILYLFLLTFKKNSTARTTQNPVLQPRRILYLNGQNECKLLYQTFIE